jgi:hypothetical protein
MEKKPSRTRELRPEGAPSIDQVRKNQDEEDLLKGTRSDQPESLVTEDGSIRVAKPAANEG